MSVLVKLYLHSNKDSNYEVGKREGFAGDKLDKFLYVGYEHEMLYEIDDEGNGTLIAVDGRRLDVKQ